MRIIIKNILAGIAAGAVAAALVSCENMLELQPVSQITPEGYFKTADQVSYYLNNYYTSFLQHPYNGYMYHDGGYNDGMVQLAKNTDILVSGLSGSTAYFGDLGQWLVPSGRNTRDGYFSYIRVANYFFEHVNSNIAEGVYDSSEEEAINHYLGEMYFFRAVAYYNALVTFGDFPIITTVLSDDQEEILENSKRAPRNEVARFILEDLDKADSLLQGRNGSLTYSGLRVNRETARLFRSRVALFEGTFEKYHRGSGRVPGDASWPGASMSYNQGKTFDIDGEITYFLTEAMESAKEVADASVLTSNSHEIEPPVGTTEGWNPYFEMFAQNDLASVGEVLMWRQYSTARDIKHRVPYRVKVGNCDGFTRQFVESFLNKDGLPTYAYDYDDSSLDKVLENRDERLQLFVWGESTLSVSDPDATNSGAAFHLPSILTSESQIRSITGYQPRKYFTYDSSQTVNDEGQGETAAPMFRSVEALLNYMEADYELNGSLSGVSRNYWRQIRERAGITADIDVTIAATDVSQEEDLGSWSAGQKLSDPTLYNIRRERLNELFCEGLRYPDLLRWRSFDQMILSEGGERWIPEGVNFWGDNSTFAEKYLYTMKDNGKVRYFRREYSRDADTGEMVENEIIMIDSESGSVPAYISVDKETGETTTAALTEIYADGSDNAMISGPDVCKFLRPYSRTSSSTNQLRDGYQWHKAYYLYPMGVDDMRYASPDENVSTTYMYQNPYWPDTAGSAEE